MVEIICGAAFTGTETTLGVPVVNDPSALQAILNEFKNRGHLHIDTARNYVWLSLNPFFNPVYTFLFCFFVILTMIKGNGTSEVLLASVDYAKQGNIILCYAWLL